MKILKLSLENFQGIRSLTVDLDGKNAAIYGDNATGKTTVFNAVTWLLFDKPSNGSKGFTPKTRGANGELHNLEHSAELLIESTDGEKLTLKKSFHEVYKRKRGSLEEEFSGHTVDYFINGVPAKEREYSEKVAEICGNIGISGEVLMAPNYFPEVMGWADRRSLLVSICGDVTDEEIFASSDELEELADILVIPGTDGKHYTVEEFKKIAAAKKSEINKRIASIPARIDEANKAIPELTEISTEAIAEKIANLDKLIADLEGKKAKLTANGVDRSKLDDLKSQMAQARAEYIRKSNEQNEAINAEITAAQSESRDAVVKLSRAKNELSEKESERGRMERARADLLKEYTEAAALKFPESSEICPTCHRRFDEAKLDELKAGFDKRKKERLADINRRGQAVSKEKIDGLVAEIKALRETVATLEEEYKLKSEKVTKLNSEIVVVKPFDTTDEALRLSQLIEAETIALECDRTENAERMQKITDELNALKTAKAAEEEKIAKIKIAQIQRKRIEELAIEEKTLGAEFSELERSIYLCEAFTRAKVSALDSRINSRFETVRFRLFEEQINGGLRDCCDVMIPRSDGVLVPFMFANTAARINAGIEIISVLSEYFGNTLPVIVDNAESVTKLRNIPAQVVRLVVSERDKVLRIEL